MDIARLLDKIDAYIKPTTETIKMYKKILETTSVYENRNLLFYGDIHVMEAKINSLSAQYVNENKFDPKSYLSVTNQEQQRIKRVKVKKLKVNWLAITEIGEKKVQDFVLADSRVKVPISVAGLESRNLRMSENMTINNIPVKDLTNKMVTVETGDSFNKISQIGVGKTPAIPRTLKLQDNSVIQNLYVDLIDDVSIINLLNSVFVSKINNVINGNVHFKASVRTKELVAGKFNTQAKPNVKYIPHQMNIYPHLQPHVPLYRPYPPRQQYWAPYTQGGRRYKRYNPHDEERTIRIKKIKIIGDLKVARLLFQNSSLVVNNRSVPTTDLKKQFWTNETPQEVNGSIHFVQGISIGGSLESPVVNSKNLSCFATRSNFNSLIFENIHIDGNLTTRENAVPRMHENELQSSVFKVLNVNHLQSEYINGKKSDNILRIKDLLEGGLKIETDDLKVEGDLEAELINNIDVKQKFNSALMTDRGFVLNEVEFKNISGDNINVKNLNNHSLESLEGFPSAEKSNAFIHGDVHVLQLSNVSLINNYPANFSKVVNRRKGATVYGKKKFNGQVKIINEIKITNINNDHFESLSTNILRKTADQDVTGFYTTTKAEMKSLFNVSEINGVSLSKFVYISQPQVSLINNIKFKTIAVDGNVTSASLQRSCKLPKVEDEIVFEGASQWSTVNISGDSTWPKWQGDRLHHLFDSAVQSHGNQTITGDVTIKHMSVKNITVHSLNDKNITFIFQDTLSRIKHNQVISGRKTFLDSFKCKNINIKGDASVKSINNVNINDINEKLVHRRGDWREVVYGHKTFLNGFHAFTLKCPEGINGVKANNIVGREFSGIAPPLVVKSLKVYGPLNVETIDDVHIRTFLQDCIYLDSSDKQLIKGQIHITGNVTLQGNVTTSGINNISTNDIVFVNNKKEQARISGCKRFISNIEIETEPKIHILNGRNLAETYRENVKTDQNVTIKGSVMILSEVEVETIYAQEYFVGPKKLTYLNKTFLP